MLHRFRLTAIFLALVTCILPLRAQAQNPVVYGVFFFSPTCPHCRDVIDNHWPGIRAEFGDRLQVLFIDVTTAQGSAEMTTAQRALHITSNGVPMLIIGSTVLLGSLDIPQRAPVVIRAGLASGGIGLPAIPGIEALFQAAGQLQTPSHNATGASADPANAIAVGVAVALALSLVIVLLAGWLFLTHRDTHLLALLRGNLGWGAQFLGAAVGISLAVSLLVGSAGNVTVAALASAVSLTFLLIGVSLYRTSANKQPSDWLVPLVALAGLIVAGYLAYVEVTLSEAVCGSLSGCNTVQASSYARIVGIPVGVIGIFGYSAILLLWLTSRWQRSAWADAALLIFALLGTGFSVYLTIVEPFVIGASCVWCLTSAVAMVMLLWMTAPAGWNALRSRVRVRS